MTATMCREVTDAHGRVYRIGETDYDLLGRSRAYMVWLPWIAMMAVSVFEYGFGAAEETLQHAHHWSLGETYWLMAIWGLIQSGLAPLAGRLREKDILPARAAMYVGAVLSGFGFLTVALFHSLIIAYIGFAIGGGIGVGLVYATCINMVGKWFPERRGGKTGFVNGGFAYGAVPWIFVFNYALNPHTYVWLLTVLAVFMLVVVGICAHFFQDPPKNWWPADVDPLKKPTSQRAARSLAKNPPAVRQFTPAEATKTGMLPLMWLAMAIASGISLFGIGYMVPFAKDLGFGPLVAASSAGVLSLLNGTGRGISGWLSDRIGRKLALILVLIVPGIGLLGLLYTGKAHLELPFLFFAFLVGFGGGAFYPLFAALTTDYFGENNNATNYGLVYSGKLVGSVVGLGIGSSVIDHLGYTKTYWYAAIIAVVAAVLVAFLRQPGRGGPLARTSDESEPSVRASWAAE